MLCCSRSQLCVVLIRLGDHWWHNPIRHLSATGAAELHQGQWAAQRHVDGVQLLSWHAEAAPGESEAKSHGSTAVRLALLGDDSSESFDS